MLHQLLHLLPLSLQPLRLSPRRRRLALRLPQLRLVLALLRQHLLHQLMQLALYLRVLVERSHQLVARLLQQRLQLLVGFPGLAQVLERLLEAQADAVAQVVEQSVERLHGVMVELEEAVLVGSQRFLDERFRSFFGQGLLLCAIAVRCSHKQRLKLLAGCSHFIAQPQRHLRPLCLSIQRTMAAALCLL